VIYHIEISIPARRDLLQLVRLTAGVVAARADLGLNDVEDLRLGVEELCLSLVGPTGDAPGRLVLGYRWDDEAIEITCTLTCVDERNEAATFGERDALAEPQVRLKTPDESLRRELSSQILDALVDEHGETHTDGRPSAWLRMRRIKPDD
jgi:anti-sigma regulatory factor (Ser/Thr protein kinase)